MKKIGVGWQYTTYDLKNGRVLKKFHSLPRAYWVITKDVLTSKWHRLSAVPGFVMNMKLKALESFRALKKCNVPIELIGHPRFINSLDYEQDKATVLGEIFGSVSIRGQKKLVDDFVEFNLHLLGYGVIDKSFNITKNFGRNDNQIILIDIGELPDDTEIIARQIQNRPWTKEYVTSGLKESEVREYFIAEMDKAFLSK